MLQIDMPVDLTFGVQPTQSAVTFQPEPGFFPNNQFIGQESPLNIGLSDLKDLMTKYQTSVGLNSDLSLVSSGGVQQFINRLTMKNKDHSHSAFEGCEKRETSFMEQGDFPMITSEAILKNMPDDALLHIFSYLGSKDLCRTSAVCKRWHHLSHDELLWKHKLNQDVRSWHVIGHMTNPDMYRECESDWSSKEIYLRCSPEFNQMRQREFSHFINFSSLFRSLLPRHAPKVAMFGPGLENDTSSIFRNILWDKSGDFQRTALVPGEVAGMGSGIAFKLKNQLDFHLFTLYSSTREERVSWQSLSPGKRLKKNKMLRQLANVEADGEGGDDLDQAKFELSNSLREVSRKMNAFVYVVNSSSEVDSLELKWSRHELFAMVNEQWANPNVPLLVLTCTKDNSKSRRSCVDIVKYLQLGKLSRPWQVHDCVVEELEGVASGLDWLLRRAQQS